MSRSPALARHALALLFFSHVALAPSLALACTPIAVDPAAPAPVFSQDHSDLHWGIAFATGGVVNATLIGLQLATPGEMFPAWLAGIELAVGIGQTIFGSLMLVGSSWGFSSCGGNSWGDEALISSGLLIGVGGWLIAHAIWSFVDGDEDPAASASVQPTFSASPDGALVGVVGTF